MLGSPRTVWGGMPECGFQAVREPSGVDSVNARRDKFAGPPRLTRRTLFGSPRRSRLGLERPDGDDGVTRTDPSLAFGLRIRPKNDGTLGVGPRAQRCPDMLGAANLYPKGIASSRLLPYDARCYKY